MKTPNMVSKQAQHYILSLINLGRIFTPNTVLTRFPKEDRILVTNFIDQSISRKGYVPIRATPVYLPNKFFQETSSAVPVVVQSRSSIVGGKRRINLPVSSSMIRNFGLSTRQYPYSVDENKMTVTIYTKDAPRGTKTKSMSVWSTGKSVIYVGSTGQYTVTTK